MCNIETWEWPGDEAIHFLMTINIVRLCASELGVVTRAYMSVCELERECMYDIV